MTKKDPKLTKKLESYDNFYKRNKRNVFFYLLRLTGDYHLSFDFMQESFTQYFSRYQGKSNNCALLYTIARNAAFDSFRKCREKTLKNVDKVISESNPERQLIEKQEFNRMIAAIQKLSPCDRELISLLAVKTFTYKEIGKLLNISEANVKVKVHRARIRLKTILENGGQ